MKADGSRQVNGNGEAPGRNRGEALAAAETAATTRGQTSAESSGLMEAVCERGNLRLAYQRVVENKGAAGVDGIGVAEFKAHLKQHWPSIKAKLLGGRYVPAPVRRVDIPKPQGGMRTLGVPTLTDRLIQRAPHQALQPIFEAVTSQSPWLTERGRHEGGGVAAAGLSARYLLNCAILFGEDDSGLAFRSQRGASV